MLKNFRSYQLSIQFYQLCQELILPDHLMSQLLRAASSITLNLAEGSAKPTKRDQIKFYFIAFGSLRECQAILTLSAITKADVVKMADNLGGHLFKLTHQAQPTGLKTETRKP